MTNIDPNQSGSEMVQGKYKAENEKMNNFLTLWESLDIAVEEVQVGQSFAIADAFGHCEASETEQWSVRNDGPG